MLWRPNSTRSTPEAFVGSPGLFFPLGGSLYLEPCESVREFAATMGLSHPCTSLGGNAWKPEPPHYTGGPGVTQGQGRPSLKGSSAFPAAQGLKLHAAGPRSSCSVDYLSTVAMRSMSVIGPQNARTDMRYACGQLLRAHQPVKLSPMCPAGQVMSQHSCTSLTE